MKKLYLLLGNGNSIGIVNKINAYRLQIGQPQLQVSLTNLFYYGASFPFPMTKEPFLTQEHCPNLWTLGARPGMDSAKANEIISQIITCGNVYALAKYQEQVLSVSDDRINRILYQYPHQSMDDQIINRLYFDAYGEFSSYIRYLMIWYNSQITRDDLVNIDVPLVNYIRNNYQQFEKIIINDYNYDIIMERLFMVNEIPFYLGCFQEPNSKIVFYKPHGSISFSYKKRYMPGTTYYIPYNELSFQQKIKITDFDIRYQLENDYPVHNGMVPPYGEAERYEISYYQKLRNQVILAAGASDPGDLYYIIGSAYGTYDRFELDRINTRFDKLVDVTYVNPAPNPDYNAVLTSLFVHYSQIPDFPSTCANS